MGGGIVSREENKNINEENGRKWKNKISKLNRKNILAGASKHEILSVDEDVSKTKYLILNERVSKNGYLNTCEEKVLTENKLSASEVNLSRVESLKRREVTLLKIKNLSNVEKSLVVENLDNEDNTSRDTNLDNEDNTSRDANLYSGDNTSRDDNLDKEEKNSRDDNLDKEEKNSRDENLGNEEKISSDENLGNEEKNSKDENQEVEELHGETSSVEKEVPTNENTNIVKGNFVDSDQKSKSRSDEKEKESAATLLSDTLRACISPKSSDSGTVSVPLPPPEDTSSTVSNSSLDDANERGMWSRQLDFFLSCVGYAVGLGNIWRFPYLCYRSGGGAFLVPYLLFLIICGMPLFFLEMSFGQFASLGPIAIWKICPLFKGLGYGMVIISGIVCIYYNVIIAWTLYYIYQSINVPWRTCTNLWNTENCIDSSASTISSSVNSSTFSNVSLSDTVLNTTMLLASNANKTTSSEEFWLLHVLRQSNGIDKIGELQLPLVLTLFLAWVVVFLCLQKGVKSSGKVVYFSATFPYFILVILLIRGLTLPGAWKGIAFYLSPRWELLMSFKVWADAATQIFYSVGAAWGALLTMASYNKFSNNVYRDSLLIPMINCGTSIFAGFVVFAIIGFMSHETGKPIDKVVAEGPGLAFIVYPEAVARLPLSPFWAILFFIMLFTIGLDSQFGMFETAVSAFVDEFPSLLKKRKTLFTAFLCFILFLLGLPIVTQGGIYILQLMDWYSATFSLMIISLLETIVISYIYGIDRFLQDINLMIKKTPPFWWKLCWCYITPGTIISLLIFIFINHQPVTYDKYVYPQWSIIVGWLIAFCSIVPIPLVAILQIAKAEGTLKERIVSCLRPSPEWGPALEENRILYRKSLAIVASNFPQKNFSGLAHSASNAHIADESGLCMVQKDEAPNPDPENSV